jgi:hypothetical protein
MAKEKVSLYVASEGILAIERGSFTTRNEEVFTSLKQNLLGGSSSPGTHGSGPLAYDGFKNKSGTLFCGENKSDKSKKLVMFEKRGTSQMESIISGDDEKQLLQKCTCTKVVSQGDFEIPEPVLKTPEVQEGNYEPLLQNLAREICNTSGKNVPKASYSEKQKILTVRFSSNNILYIGIRVNNNVPIVFFESRLLDNQATNVAEATYLSPNKSLLDGIATILVKSVQKLPTSFISKGILNIVNNYDVYNSFITKKERKTLKQSSKVSYTQSALKSCLRNIDLLEKPIAEQYVPVFQEFFTNLHQLSKTNGVALQIVQCFSLKGKAITIPIQPKGVDAGDTLLGNELATSNPSGSEGESGASTAPRRTRMF